MTSWVRGKNQSSKHYKGNAIDIVASAFIENDKPIQIKNLRDFSKYYWLGYYVLLDRDFTKSTPGLGINCAVPDNWNGIDSVFPKNVDWCPHYHIHKKTAGSADFMFEGSDRDKNRNCVYTRRVTNIVNRSQMVAKIIELFYGAGGTRAELQAWTQANRQFAVQPNVISPHTGTDATDDEILEWIRTESGLTAMKEKRDTEDQWSLLVQAAAGLAIGFVLAKMKKNA